jgi:hypothetical protein
MSRNLGEFMQLDLRQLWPSESSDFTPWLAEEDNIALLAKEIGLELSVENTEVSVGPYSADILARDAATGSYVVIENQLTKTDHDHLGKLLTYGSALDASAVVWIAGQFTEEHQRALEWLNDNSKEDVAFFGVRVELWKIDESAPAVRFVVVSQPPTSIRRTAVTSALEELTPTRKIQLEFWSEFQEALAQRPEIPSTRTPRPQWWYNVSLGRSGVVLSNTASVQEERIAVRVLLRGSVAGFLFEELLLQRQHIESAFGEVLEWDPNPDARQKLILISRSADLHNRARWLEYIDWMVDRTVRMREILVPILRQIDFSQRSE